MIHQLINVVDTLIAQISQKGKKIQPGLHSVSDDLGTVAIRDSLQGLFVRRSPFCMSSDDLFRLTFRGRIIIGNAVPNKPPLSTLRLAISFRTSDNPEVLSAGTASVVAKEDGNYELIVPIQFRDATSTPFRLKGVATVENTDVQVETETFTIENATLDWLIDTIAKEEQRLTPTNRLEFVSKVRKLFFSEAGNKLFDLLFGNSVTPLYQSNSDQGRRWRALREMKPPAAFWFRNEFIRFGHVLTGIEGGRRQTPQIQLPERLKVLTSFLTDFLVIGDLVTWAGDLGSALQEYLYQHFYPQFFNHPAIKAKRKTQDPDYETIDGYIASISDREQLIADIDGINLAAIYDQSKSLTDNLRSYYGSGGEKRFSQYLQTQEAQAGQKALFLDPEQSKPMLTGASLQFIASRIASVAEILLFATLMDAAGETKVPLPLTKPQGVILALEPDSPEVQKLVRHYTTFLENGLAGENQQ